ncbi:MAG: DAK2 domain-containing protein [Dehalococcoidia bacterium]
MGTSAEAAGPAGRGSGPAEAKTRLAPEGANAPGLSGDVLRDMFAAATSFLQRNTDAINAINVFPVPDGDTGTNMHLTMAAAMEEAPRADGSTAEAIARAMAHGALLGARGNSGVILSQMLRGLAKGIGGQRQVDANILATALEEASAAAYGALSEPVEGTMLTVMREAAAAARGRADGSATEVLAAAVKAAQDALARTPDLLPVLKEAGVVDAGGQGLCVLLEASLAFLRGEAPTPRVVGPRELEASWLAATEVLHHEGETPYGYCTEFLISSQGLDREAIQRRVTQMGQSVLVVGDAEVVRVHLHTTDPGGAISFGTSLGSLSGVKVEDMEAQLQAFVERHRERPPTEWLSVGVVAVAAGEGLRAALESMITCRVVPGGQTMNPSALEILDAIQSCPVDRVVVLPNNKNVILAARQAAEHSSKEVVVVPTISVPQGVAAVLALSQDMDLEANVAAMTAAMNSVRSAEVTRAVRATAVGGRHVAEGEAIGIVDGELCVAESRVEDAAQACIRRMAWPEASLLTLYFGEQTSRQEADALADQLRAEHSSLEVEVVDGGQPHYPYLISME